MATWSNCMSRFRAIAAGVMLTTLPGALLPLSAQEQPPPQPAQETQLQQLVLARSHLQTTVPNTFPIPAVIAIANAPQNVTRAVVLQ
jgi:hypothetical protein